MSNLHFLKVKVVRIDEDRHKFIVEHEGKIYQVSQLAFQRQQPKPDFIDCIYYQTDNGASICRRTSSVLCRSGIR